MTHGSMEAWKIPAQLTLGVTAQVDAFSVSLGYRPYPGPGRVHLVGNAGNLVDDTTRHGHSI